MGLFGVKEEEIKELIKVEGGVIKTETTQEISLTEKALKRDISELDLNTNKKFKEVDDRILILTQVIENLQKGQKATDKITVNNPDVDKPIDGDITDIHILCRTINIKGFYPTQVKYFLFDNGILDLNIHETKNTFSSKPIFDETTNMELAKTVHWDNKRITFTNEFVTYCSNHKEDVLRCIEKYANKQRQYKESKKKLESKNVKNYNNEIDRICGIGLDYDENKYKWAAIYKVFKMDFPTFEDDIAKYRKEHSDSKYPITKVKYVVSVMGEGNYLLKIACDLFA